MRNSVFGLWFAISSIGLAACAATTPPALGGETNWLKRCADGESCKSGSCVCGVCTAPCDADKQCAGDFAGTCISTLERVGASACESMKSASAIGLCLPDCVRDAECGDSFACREGVCVTDVTARRVDAARASDVAPRVDAGMGSSSSGETDDDPVRAQEPPATQPDPMTPAAVDPEPTAMASSCPDGVHLGRAEIRVRSDIDRLRDCSQVAGDLIIIGSELEDLSGLEALRTVQGRLTIANNEATTVDLAPTPTTIPAALKSLKGLEGLQTVGSLALVGLQITTLEPLSQLQTAPVVWVLHMSGLRDLKGLGQLDWETLTVARNDELLSLAGLRVQASKHAKLEIDDCPKLSDLTALQELRSVSDRIKLSNLDIGDLTGLRGLQSVGDAATGAGGLTIIGCARLRDLSGLGQLTSAAGLLLHGNENLETLAGMTLSAPPKTLGITESPRLVSLAAAIPEGAWNANSIALQGLPSIASLSDFRALQSATSLMIQECDGLKDLTGFEQLETAGQVFIMGCAGLTSLTGLDNLTTVTGIVVVSTNPALTSARQLGGLESVGSVQLSGNTMLAQCEVDWLAAQLKMMLPPDLNGSTGTCASEGS